MRQTRITWFIISSLLGILFIIWGAITNTRPLIPGDSWLVLPGLILFAIGLFGVLEDYLMDRRVINYLNSRDAENKTLIEITDILNYDEKQLGEIIITLRAQGKMKKYFDPNNGFLVSQTQGDIIYCLYCTSPNITGNFCTVCGKENTLSDEKKE